MAQQFAQIEPAQRDFIARQHMFFVATAAAGGRVNLSPKGLDALRVLGPNMVAYLDRTGSGNVHCRGDWRCAAQLSVA